MKTQTIKIDPTGSSSPPFGSFPDAPGPNRLGKWTVNLDHGQIDALSTTAEYLRSNVVPVAFPTETVYGLGADATRSDSVKGIYAAKGRPSDNPLIVHVCDLDMLRSLLHPATATADLNGTTHEQPDPIPQTYKSLIDKFWPGPLTILLPSSLPSRLAPEVTAGLATFGVRMPSSTLALSLIKLAGVPLAAPSANASTRPSPTTAQHVVDDLSGRIELVLDGGPCRVGVESTVVDGLCDPPVVLRPGGVGIGEIRACQGWEGVVKGYQDACEMGSSAPRAPGMKYKHYSPRARVVLYEYEYEHDAASDGSGGGVGRARGLSRRDLEESVATTRGEERRVGIIRTKSWPAGAGLQCEWLAGGQTSSPPSTFSIPWTFSIRQGALRGLDGKVSGTALDIDLGRDSRAIAQRIFAALRELDRRGADTIFVEGIDDTIDVAAAVMNRLRKAASEVR